MPIIEAPNPRFACNAIKPPPPAAIRALLTTERLTDALQHPDWLALINPPLPHILLQMIRVSEVSTSRTQPIISLDANSDTPNLGGLIYRTP
jgi:hypothetical protein